MGIACVLTAVVIATAIVGVLSNRWECSFLSRRHSGYNHARRLPIDRRLLDADKRGWNDAHLKRMHFPPEEVRPMGLPARRSAIGRWLVITAAICLGLLATALIARAAETVVPSATELHPVTAAGECANSPATPSAEIMPEAGQHTAEPAERTRWQIEPEPFRRCAMKALAGQYGVLRPWQRCAYEWGLARGVTCCGVAKLTTYGYKWESARMAGGTQTASNSRVHLGGCAANPEIPFGTLIWTPYGLRYVTDRGGWVKVGYVASLGKYVTNGRETANLDYYTWAGLPTLRSAPWAIVKPARQTDRGTWYRPMSTECEETP